MIIGIYDPEWGRTFFESILINFNFNLDKGNRAESLPFSPIIFFLQTKQKATLISAQSIFKSCQKAQSPYIHEGIGALCLSTTQILTLIHFP